MIPYVCLDLFQTSGKIASKAAFFWPADVLKVVFDTSSEGPHHSTAHKLFEPGPGSTPN